MMLEVGHHDLEQRVDVAGNEMASDYLGHGDDRLLERLGPVAGVILDLDAEEHGQAQSDAAAPEAIAATLQDYIDGARAGDGALLRNAFLEPAYIGASYDGKPVDWTLPEFCEAIHTTGSAADIAARIVSIRERPLWCVLKPRIGAACAMRTSSFC